MPEPEVSLEQQVSPLAVGRPTTEMVSWLEKKSRDFGQTLKRVRTRVENGFTVTRPNQSPEVISMPSPEKAAINPTSKYLEHVAEGQRLSIQLKDQTLVSVFQYLDMVVRSDTSSNPDYVHTFVRLCNENSGRKVADLVVRLTAIRKSYQLTPEQETVVDKAHSILEEIKPQIAKNILTRLASRNTSNPDWNQRFEQAKSEELETKLRRSTAGGTDVCFTFISPKTADRQKVQSAMERVVTTWERFTKGSVHDSLLANEFKKQIDVPIILLDDPRQQFIGLRAYAHMDEPGIVISLDDPNPNYVSMHEAIHAVIGAYTKYPFSSDFAEACTTYYNNQFYQQEFGEDSRDKPQQFSIDTLTDMLENNAIYGLSTTQVLEQDDHRNPLDQAIRAQQKDVLQYTFGYFLMDAFNKCTAMR